ncbi:unnamed protein product [Pleuronectes platessa]|uniref:Uncharacterized protein n=1 Tax=Pleuronectes platessa TaxID=8262 RepID=A0A9N7YYZ2_PLEPL|nr:unnamed protein product [Pleuronectes platessa]
MSGPTPLGVIGSIAAFSEKLDKNPAMCQGSFVGGARLVPLMAPRAAKQTHELNDRTTTYEKPSPQRKSTMGTACWPAERHLGPVNVCRHIPPAVSPTEHVVCTSD